MKIIFVSGFLGAGKTRFIKTMSEKTKRKFVIVENEFADINIDADRLRDLQNNPDQIAGAEAFTNVVELTEGCICCSLNLDFNHSLLTIANTLNPDYLVVEPSGVAKTSQLLTNIQSICYEFIEMIAPITLIDGHLYQKSRQENPEIFKNQIQVAGTLVISRSEDFTDEDFTRIQTDLHLPEDIHFPKSHYESWDEKEWQNLLLREYVHQKADVMPQKAGQGRFVLRSVKKDAEKLSSISFKTFSLQHPDALVAALNILASGVVGKIARAKGNIPSIKNTYLTFDYVEGLYSVMGVEGTAEPGFVVIGKDLNEEAISKMIGGTRYYKNREDESDI